MRNDVFASTPTRAAAAAPAGQLEGRSPTPEADGRSNVETRVLRIKGLIQSRQFSAALEVTQELLREVPENRDVLYMLAVSQRHLRRIPAALATLEQLESLHPGYGRLFQERGHCLVAAGNPGAATEAYRRAVELNAALPASWKALELLYRSAGQTADSRIAAEQAGKLSSLPPEVLAAINLFADGEILEAERVIRAFLRTHGDHIEGMRLLAQIGLQLEVLDDADFLLESVLAFAPDYHLARYDYVCVLLKRHQNAKALGECRKLLSQEPQNCSYRALRAAVHIALGEHADALRLYRELLVETPQVANLHLSKAHVLKTIGQQQEAIESYRSAAHIRPSFGDAYWSLANLKTYRFLDAEIEVMRCEEARAAVNIVDRYHLCFALGKALEDREQYAESFQYYARGNALKKTQIRYRPSRIERNAALQAALFTPQFLAARRGLGCPAPDPIFVVGLPRSGSTLIEQILASHSLIEGTMELADIAHLVQRLQGREQGEGEGEGEAPPRYPGVLAELGGRELRELGETYLAETQIYRRAGKPLFIDKMPNNFRHLGLIHLILPNARIIDARREPMACCFSNFKQLFASGQEFTYSFQDIARYYRSYVALMSHWEAVLPGRILRVQYEEVVSDLEGNVQRLLEFCGLPFESQCLEFHQTQRSVATASSEQVRRPIFQEGLEHWRRFEPWLSELREALEEHADP